MDVNKNIYKVHKHYVDLHLHVYVYVYVHVHLMYINMHMLMFFYSRYHLFTKIQCNVIFSVIVRM
jgi:hypothetical protein